LFECYGGKTLALLRRDPYAVLQHVGAEFELADQIAERVGIERQDPRRSRAALQSILMRAANQEGNTALPRSELLARTLSRKLQLTGECSEMALAQLLQDDLLSAVPHSDYIGLSSLISAEKTVASRLLEFANYPIKRDILTPPQNLLPEQAAAVMAAQQNRFMILTGSPGTGKTFTLRSILACGWEKPLLAAPTGKAANRLSELTGLPAYTLHRLLEYRPSQDGLHRCSERTLDADLVIVDEAAMLDIPLAAALLQSIDPKQTSLLLSGDADQLPSVGPGNLLRDLIDSQRFQVTRLTQIVRQDQHSQIIPNAQRIIQGNPIRVDNQTYLDFKFFAIDDSTQLLEQRDIADTLCRLFDHLLELGYNSRDIQVLTPMKKGGIPGAYELNTLLQQKLNPSTQARVWQAHKQQFRLLDRVIQLRNDYERGIFNGDTGIIAQIDESHLHVQFDDRVVQYDESNISQLELAYAISIHKSQGSEWPVVILPMSLGHKQMLTRRLFYTALTRARTLFMLIASPRAVAHAIAHNDDNDRITSLPSWLAQASGM
jgi:exodeoxyribonuclease V alpha subunit